jgi:uncharacterized membrane protein
MVSDSPKALNRLRIPPQLTAFLPLAVLGVMMVVATPPSVAAVEKVHDAGGPPYGVPTCFAPVFPWIRNNVKEPSVVLAPDTQNDCIPAYSAKANVVSVRGSQVLAHLPALEHRAGRKIKVPQRALDEQTFFHGATPRERRQILRHYNVDYVMAYEDSPTDKQLRHLSGLSAVGVPDKYFDLYKVEQRT